LGKEITQTFLHLTFWVSSPAPNVQLILKKYASKFYLVKTINIILTLNNGKVKLRG